MESLLAVLSPKKWLLMMLLSVTLKSVQFMQPDCDWIASIYPLITKTTGILEKLLIFLSVLDAWFKSIIFFFFEVALPQFSQVQEVKHQHFDSHTQNNIILLEKKSTWFVSSGTISLVLRWLNALYNNCGKVEIDSL